MVGDGWHRAAAVGCETRVVRFLASEVAAAVGGELLGDDVRLDGVTQDSRSVTPSCLFVPLVADRDGHDFIEAAVRAGAGAHLTAASPGPGTAIRVADTGTALVALAAAARRSLNGTVVGITGSVGKTSVKAMTAAVVARSGPVHASPQSVNNEIGVPLTLVNAPDGASTVVVELGARHEGDIAALCEVVLPDIGVVTTVAAAHTGVLGPVDVVARTKGELLDRLPAHGCAVLNADVPEVMAQAGRTRSRLLTFGKAGEVRARAVVLDDGLCPSFRLESPWGRTDVRLSARGAHMVDNALAAAAVGLVLDVSLEDVAVGLGEARLSPGRMGLSTAPSGLVVLNDAYNANPASMEAGLAALAALPVGGRRLAVLGLMAELGAGEAVAHRQIAALASATGIEVVAVGTDLYGVEALAGVDEALALIGGMGLGEGDAVLVKGSLVAGLQELAERLADG